ncbi:MAG: 5-formyltetrahydrofolate cyclo-ligase, partial [Clostridia bacterium]|nr:5-formyltetrahydrofolate cyclo-ligase [Clostridia bacterium]
MTDKIFLRKKVLAKRDELANKREKSQKICETVLKSNLFKNAKTVFVFLSFGSEVDTSLIVKTCFEQGKKVCVPVCKKDCIMDAVSIQNMADMVYNNYGIAEPKDVSNVVDKHDIDLIIVP